MTHRLSLDRFEGKDKSIAVLLTEDGDADQRSQGAPAPRRQGRRRPDADASSVTPRPRAKLAEETRAVQEDLKTTDPGGDIKL